MERYRKVKRLDRGYLSQQGYPPFNCVNIADEGQMEDTKLNETFDYIDLIRKKVDAAKKEPEFSQERRKRKKRTRASLKSDRDVLRKFAELIASSQNARSASVNDMLSKGKFEEAFCGFEVRKVRTLEPADVENTYWHAISAIRFKRKIGAIINSAKLLPSIQTEYGSFTGLIERTEIPARLRSVDDVEKFWQGFDCLLRILKEKKMPFFGRTTSLLHFLLSVGYDCAKPDKIVMKVAKEGDMIPSETGEQNMRKVVRNIQLYCVDRQIRPSVVDLYFLIYGKQTAFRQFVYPWFYP